MFCPFGPVKRDGWGACCDGVQDVRNPHTPSLVREPEWLETHIGGPEQGQSILFRTTVSPLMRQDDAVLVRLQPQRGDQVPAPSVPKGDLMDVHRRRIWFEGDLTDP